MAQGLRRGSMGFGEYPKWERSYERVIDSLPRSCIRGEPIGCEKKGSECRLAGVLHTRATRHDIPTLVPVMGSDSRVLCRIPLEHGEPCSSGP
ncbi:Zinc finger BED domain-containing protein DAYSLEEPER [Fusarium oxysporum f. sp. albedinis]|nr:Zinc finger BED domain-containing protein DAYSLEEPER [Fusarium oxysporum f. sp. albedinis]